MTKELNKDCIGKIYKDGEGNKWVIREWDEDQLNEIYAGCMYNDDICTYESYKSIPIRYCENFDKNGTRKYYKPNTKYSLIIPEEKEEYKLYEGWVYKDRMQNSILIYKIKKENCEYPVFSVLLNEPILHARSYTLQGIMWTDNEDGNSTLDLSTGQPWKPENDLSEGSHD